jgi:hypothetical protein
MTEREWWQTEYFRMLYATTERLRIAANRSMEDWYGSAVDLARQYLAHQHSENAV